MPAYQFERIARTPYSEQWRIETETHTVGRIDLHFTDAKTYGTLALHSSIPQEEIEELIADIDARLVCTADEYREDFVVTVWRGAEFGTYSEDASPEDDEDDEELEDELDDDDEDEDEDLDEFDEARR